MTYLFLLTGANQLRRKLKLSSPISAARHTLPALVPHPALSGARAALGFDLAGHGEGLLYARSFAEGPVCSYACYPPISALAIQARSSFLSRRWVRSSWSYSSKFLGAPVCAGTTLLSTQILLERLAS